MSLLYGVPLSPKLVASLKEVMSYETWMVCVYVYIKLIEKQKMGKQSSLLALGLAVCAGMGGVDAFVGTAPGYLALRSASKHASAGGALPLASARRMAAPRSAASSLKAQVRGMAAAAASPPSYVSMFDIDICPLLFLADEHDLACSSSRVRRPSKLWESAAWSPPSS
jgi:hypothetical protein